MSFIIHPCDPTVVICNLIWPCDIAVCITYLISHSSSLPYNLRIFQFGCIINTKLPSCGDIIRRTSLGFPSWFSESTRPTDSCFQGTSCENLMMYGGLYQHTRVVLYIYLMSLLPLELDSHHIMLPNMCRCDFLNSLFAACFIDSDSLSV